MDWTLTDWPLLNRLMWTLIIVGAAYGLGLVINAVVIRWLQRLADRTSDAWDDAVVQELRKRIPLWSLLIGLWLSISTWPIEARWIALSSTIVGALAVLSVTMAVSAISVRLLVGLAPRVNPEMHVSGLMRNLVRAFILSIGILIVLRGFGVEITPVLAALGVGGLAAALALQAPLASLFSGLFITLAGQLQIGDYIRLDGGTEGRIVDFSWDAAKLRTLADNLVVVPNAKLAQAVVTNFQQPSPGGGFAVEVTVAADSDLGEVERLALQVARAVDREVQGGLTEAEPTVRFQAFTDLGIRFAIGLRNRRLEDQQLVRHEMIKRLQAEFRRAGIEVPTLGKADSRKPKAAGS